MKRRTALKLIFGGGATLAVGAGAAGKAYWESLKKPENQRELTYFPRNKLKPELESGTATIPVERDIQPPETYGLSNITSEQLKTAQGEEFTLWHSKDLDPDKKTLIIFPGNFGHLGESYKDAAVTGADDYYISLIKKAEEAGYQIIAAEHVGFSGSNVDPTEAGIYRGVERTVEWTLKERGILPNNILLFGISMGTTLAAHAANVVSKEDAFKASNSQKIRCVLANGTIDGSVILKDVMGDYLGEKLYPDWQEKFDTGKELKEMASTAEKQRICVHYLGSSQDKLTPKGQAEAHAKAAEGLVFSQAIAAGKHYISPETIIAELQAFEMATAPQRTPMIREPK